MLLFVPVSLFKTDACVLYTLSAKHFWMASPVLRQVHFMHDDDTMGATKEHKPPVPKNPGRVTDGFEKKKWSPPPPPPILCKVPSKRSSSSYPALYWSLITRTVSAWIARRLLSSPLFFFFLDQQQQSKNKERLECWWATRAICSRSLYTHCSVFSIRLSRPHERRREQSRSRSAISRIRADGRRDQRTKPWPHAHDRKFGCSFVVSTLKPEEKIPAAAAALTGWEAVVWNGNKKALSKTWSNQLFFYDIFFLFALACRNNHDAFQSVRKTFCTH